MTFAADTEVSVEKSRAEIERLLTRYGASEFLSGWKDGQAVIGFRMHDRMLRFVLPLPAKGDFKKDPRYSWKDRPAAAQERAWEQAQRQRWRALCLIIKAKLESVEARVETFEQAFLAEILMANGQTVSEWIAPSIEETYQTGTMPQLALPAPRGF